MSTVFSHIIQKRLSQENENIATEALTFILESSDAARGGMTKLLRGIAPELPPLHYRTQQTDGNAARPDMCGYDGNGPRVFIENKFWAGLTENQPVPYLKSLGICPQPAILLIVVPEARKETIFRELLRRLDQDQISATTGAPPAGICCVVSTSIGPILALTTWQKLLSVIEAELSDHPSVRNDLLQLRALCEAADSQSFLPISPVQMTDQQTPAFILSLNSIWKCAVEQAVTEGFASVQGLKEQAGSQRIGRYFRFSGHREVGAWIGTEFSHWKSQGSTPLWLVFSGSDWGRAQEVRAVLEPRARSEQFPVVLKSDYFAVGMRLATGEEQEAVVASVFHCLKKIATLLSVITGPSDQIAVSPKLSPKPNILDSNGWSR